MEKNKKTINILKQTRQATKEALENGKKYNEFKKAIIKSLKDGGKTVPQIALECEMALPQTMYYVMSLLKFGELKVKGIDDMDEYYIYELKKD